MARSSEIHDHKISGQRHHHGRNRIKTEPMMMHVLPVRKEMQGYSSIFL